MLTDQPLSKPAGTDTNLGAAVAAEGHYKQATNPGHFLDNFAEALQLSSDYSNRHLDPDNQKKVILQVHEGGLKGDDLLNYGKTTFGDTGLEHAKPLVEQDALALHEANIDAGIGEQESVEIVNRKYGSHASNFVEVDTLERVGHTLEGVGAGLEYDAEDTWQAFKEYGRRARLRMDNPIGFSLNINAGESKTHEDQIAESYAKIMKYGPPPKGTGTLFDEIAWLQIDYEKEQGHRMRGGAVDVGRVFSQFALFAGTSAVVPVSLVVKAGAAGASAIGLGSILHMTTYGRALVGPTGVINMGSRAAKGSLLGGTMVKNTIGSHFARASVPAGIYGLQSFAREDRLKQQLFHNEAITKEQLNQMYSNATKGALSAVQFLPFTYLLRGWKPMVGYEQKTLFEAFVQRIFDYGKSTTLEVAQEVGEEIGGIISDEVFLDQHTDNWHESILGAGQAGFEINSILSAMGATFRLSAYSAGAARRKYKQYKSNGVLLDAFEEGLNKTDDLIEGKKNPDREVDKDEKAILKKHRDEGLNEIKDVEAKAAEEIGSLQAEAAKPESKVTNADVETKKRKVEEKRAEILNASFGKALGDIYRQRAEAQTAETGKPKVPFEHATFTGVQKKDETDIDLANDRKWSAEGFNMPVFANDAKLGRSTKVKETRVPIVTKDRHGNTQVRHVNATVVAVHNKHAEAVNDSINNETSKKFVNHSVNNPEQSLKRINRNRQGGRKLTKPDRFLAVVLDPASIHNENIVMPDNVSIGKPYGDRQSAIPARGRSSVRAFNSVLSGMRRKGMSLSNIIRVRGKDKVKTIKDNVSRNFSPILIITKPNKTITDALGKHGAVGRMPDGSVAIVPKNVRKGDEQRVLMTAMNMASTVRGIFGDAYLKSMAKKELKNPTRRKGMKDMTDVFTRMAEDPRKVSDFEILEAMRHINEGPRSEVLESRTHPNNLPSKNDTYSSDNPDAFNDEAEASAQRDKIKAQMRDQLGDFWNVLEKLGVQIATPKEFISLYPGYTAQGLVDRDGKVYNRVLVKISKGHELSEAMGTLWHEVGVHLGMDWFFGGEGSGNHKATFKRFTEYLNTLADEHVQRLKDREGEAWDRLVASENENLLGYAALLARVDLDDYSQQEEQRQNEEFVALFIGNLAANIAKKDPAQAREIWRGITNDANNTPIREFLEYVWEVITKLLYFPDAKNKKLDDYDLLRLAAGSVQEFIDSGGKLTGRRKAPRVGYQFNPEYPLNDPYLIVNGERVGSVGRNPFNGKYEIAVGLDTKLFALLHSAGLESFVGPDQSTRIQGATQQEAVSNFQKVLDDLYSNSQILESRLEFEDFDAEQKSLWVSQNVDDKANREKIVAQMKDVLGDFWDKMEEFGLEVFTPLEAIKKGLLVTDGVVERIGREYERAYIVIDQDTTIDEAMDSFWHELGGHVGLHSLFTDQYSGGLRHTDYFKHFSDHIYSIAIRDEPDKYYDSSYRNVYEAAQRAVLNVNENYPEVSEEIRQEEIVAHFVGGLARLLTKSENPRAEFEKILNASEDKGRIREFLEAVLERIKDIFGFKSHDLVPGHYDLLVMAAGALNQLADSGVKIGTELGSATSAINSGSGKVVSTTPTFRPMTKTGSSKSQLVTIAGKDIGIIAYDDGYYKFVPWNRNLEGWLHDQGHFVDGEYFVGGEGFQGEEYAVKSELDARFRYMSIETFNEILQGRHETLESRSGGKPGSGTRTARAALSLALSQKFGFDRKLTQDPEFYREFMDIAFQQEILRQAENEAKKALNEQPKLDASTRPPDPFSTLNLLGNIFGKLAGYPQRFIAREGPLSATESVAPDNQDAKDIASMLETGINNIKNDLTKMEEILKDIPDEFNETVGRIFVDTQTEFIDPRMSAEEHKKYSRERGKKFDINQYNRIKADWDSLPKKAQNAISNISRQITDIRLSIFDGAIKSIETYAQRRSDGELSDESNQRIKAIRQTIKDFEATFQHPLYLPLRRRGKFFIHYEDNGRTWNRRFENAADYKRALKKVKAAGALIEAHGKDTSEQHQYDDRGGMISEFTEVINQAMKAKGDFDALVDNLAKKSKEAKSYFKGLESDKKRQGDYGALTDLKAIAISEAAGLSRVAAVTNYAMSARVVIQRWRQLNTAARSESAYEQLLSSYRDSQTKGQPGFYNAGHIDRLLAMRGESERAERRQYLEEALLDRVTEAVDQFIDPPQTNFLTKLLLTLNFWRLLAFDLGAPVISLGQFIYTGLPRLLSEYGPVAVTTEMAIVLSKYSATLTAEAMKKLPGQMNKLIPGQMTNADKWGRAWDEKNRGSVRHTMFSSFIEAPLTDEASSDAQRIRNLGSAIKFDAMQIAKLEGLTFKTGKEAWKFMINYQGVFLRTTDYAMRIFQHQVAYNLEKKKSSKAPKMAANDASSQVFQEYFDYSLFARMPSQNKHQVVKIATQFAHPIIMTALRTTAQYFKIANRNMPVEERKKAALYLAYQAGLVVAMFGAGAHLVTDSVWKLMTLVYGFIMDEDDEEKSIADMHSAKENIADIAARSTVQEIIEDGLIYALFNLAMGQRVAMNPDLPEGDLSPSVIAETIVNYGGGPTVNTLQAGYKSIEDIWAGNYSNAAKRMLSPGFLQDIWRYDQQVHMDDNGDMKIYEPGGDPIGDISLAGRIWKGAGVQTGTENRHWKGTIQALRSKEYHNAFQFSISKELTLGESARLRGDVDTANKHQVEAERLQAEWAEDYDKEAPFGYIDVRKMRDNIRKTLIKKNQEYEGVNK